jgi:hypothetical protein
VDTDMETEIEMDMDRDMAIDMDKDMNLFDWLIDKTCVVIIQKDVFYAINKIK